MGLTRLDARDLEPLDASRVFLFLQKCDRDNSSRIVAAIAPPPPEMLTHKFCQNLFLTS